MINGKDGDRKPDRWAVFRLAVVGPLLADPPEERELASRLAALASRSWTHPITGAPVYFGVSTIERWFYAARRAKAGAIAALRNRIRKDAGTHPTLTDRVRQLLKEQHRRHPGWSYWLHWKNIDAAARQDKTLGVIPSYPTVRRYMRGAGLFKSRRRKRTKDTAGAQLAAERFESHEQRSFEKEHVNALWHLDFHDGSRRVLTPDGRWAKVTLLGILDDRSRLACHLQWYIGDENTEMLVHGLMQALQKREIPWALMTDRGSAMRGAEFRRALELVLGVTYLDTLPYSPHQNGKQEAFWGQVESRLMAMLEDEPNLTLERLNEATQAWAEMGYNREVHSEIKTTPLERYLAGPDVGRPCPDSETLRQAFRAETTRRQRHSDGTVSLKGRRFEVPSRFRHLHTVTLRYTSWDLSRVDLVDARTGVVVAPLYPQDKELNADGSRRRKEPIEQADSNAKPSDGKPSGVAPYLQELMDRYADAGPAPGYIAKRNEKNDDAADGGDDCPF